MTEKDRIAIFAHSQKLKGLKTHREKQLDESVQSLKEADKDLPASLPASFAEFGNIIGGDDKLVFDETDFAEGATINEDQYDQTAHCEDDIENVKKEDFALETVNVSKANTSSCEDTEALEVVSRN